MSKRKLYDDDIYVAPYTRKTGKYRHVSGHYRRRSYRKKPSHSPSSYQHKPKGKFDFDTIFFCVVLAVMLFILIAVVQPAWLYVLFGLLIYLLIALALGCIVSCCGKISSNTTKTDLTVKAIIGRATIGKASIVWDIIPMDITDEAITRTATIKQVMIALGMTGKAIIRRALIRKVMTAKVIIYKVMIKMAMTEPDFVLMVIVGTALTGRDGIDTVTIETVSIVLASIVSVMMPLDMIRQAMIEKDSTIMGKAGSKSGKES